MERKPFMVINDLSRIFHGRLRSLAENVGINESYRHLLFHLYHGEGMTQLELAHATRLKPPTISVTLQKMENDGYVIRVPDENDMRAMRVYLTDKGKEFEAESRRVVRAMNSQAMEGMNDEDIKILMDLLDKIYFNLTGEDSKARRCCRKQGGKCKK